MYCLCTYIPLMYIVYTCYGFFFNLLWSKLVRAAFRYKCVLIKFFSMISYKEIIAFVLFPNIFVHHFFLLFLWFFVFILLLSIVISSVFCSVLYIFVNDINSETFYLFSFVELIMTLKNIFENFSFGWHERKVK